MSQAGKQEKKPKICVISEISVPLQQTFRLPKAEAFYDTSQRLVIQKQAKPLPNANPARISSQPLRTD
jgi:hypothetical protein